MYHSRTVSGLGRCITLHHWLRHAHASLFLDRGTPIHLVQQTLGHESVATTSRYLHARPNDSSSLYLP
ncbi:site-specific integrase [Microcoleus sp. ZQ-A2]